VADNIRSPEKGWIALELGVTDPARDLSIPVGRSTATFELQFTILDLELEPNPDAAPVLSAFTPVVFRDIPATVQNENTVLTNTATVDLETGPTRLLLRGDALEGGGVQLLGIGEIGFFCRADSNFDCDVNISDPQSTFNFLFIGGPSPPCKDAADANDDGRIDIADGIYTLSFLFTGGPEPPEPFDFIGRDPTHDGLGCSVAYEEGACVKVRE
jgi:hypothetical protein